MLALLSLVSFWFLLPQAVMNHCHSVPSIYGVRTLQDVGVQVLTMRELRKYNANIAYNLEARIPESGHSVIKVPGEDACYHSGEGDNTGRHGVAITPNLYLLVLASAFTRGGLSRHHQLR